MDIYDSKGNVAECLVLLIHRAQKWVIELGHDGVYKEFVEGLDSMKESNAVHENWGTPAKIRAWLSAKGAADDAAERHFASDHEYAGFNSGNGNPVAQEKEKAKFLEDALTRDHGFTPYVPRNEEVVLSQRVSGGILPSLVFRQTDLSYLVICTD
jgi:hypothetical protein